jgi:hypothetical protein
MQMIEARMKATKAAPAHGEFCSFDHLGLVFVSAFGFRVSGFCQFPRHGKRGDLGRFLEIEAC